MQKPTEVTGPRPEASPTMLFGRMVAAQKRGDFIRAGEAQLRLEHLGWTIRRKRASVRDAVAAAEDVATRPVADGDENLSSREPGESVYGVVLGLVDVAWLVGVTAEEVEKSLEAGRFPRPDGYVTGKPYWETANIDRWANRGGSL
jgi:hypothetical protein